MFLFFKEFIYIENPFREFKPPVMLTKSQQQALEEFLQDCSIPELRLSLNTKVLSAASNEDPQPITFNKPEITNFMFLYVLLEKLMLKG